jgi:hypothetical protein
MVIRIAIIYYQTPNNLPFCYDDLSLLKCSSKKERVMDHQNRHIPRREALKTLAGLGLAAPLLWTSPTIEAGLLPPHAQTSVVLETGVAQCGQLISGTNSAEVREIEMGKPAGTFVFEYETYMVKDQIIVSYEGTVLFDTGCVGADGSPTLTYSGTSTRITVQVIPNCAGTPSTGWDYRANCPT